MFLRTAYSFVAVTGLITGILSAQDLEELEVDHALTFQVSTPHTDWAQPYALGKARVLFFTNGRGTAPRECVELMQRFDLEAEAVFWTRIVDSRNEHWHGGEVGEQRMLRLLEQPWDCFVFFGMNLERMSPEAQYKILKPVTEGAGLLFVGATDKRVLKPENKIEGEDAFVGVQDTLNRYTVGKGRGTSLGKPPEIPYQEDWNILYDYQAEAFGKVLLWTAGKASEALMEIVPPQEAIDRASKQAATLRIALTGTTVAPAPGVAVRIRKPGIDPLDLGAHPAHMGDVIELPIPLLPEGDYHVDAILSGNAGVETWSTATFAVTSPTSVQDVILDQTWGEIGEKISGTVLIEGNPAAGDRVRIVLKDRRKRILMEEWSDGPTTEVPFSFPTHTWMPMLITVEGRLVDAEGNEISRKYTYFNLTKRHRGRFNFLIWDTPRGTLAPYAEESLARNSVTLQLGQGNPKRICAAYDIAWIPYTTRIMSSLTPESIMKPFCWNDAAAVSKHVDEKAEAYAGARQHGVFVWSLGDEVHTKGSCLSPHCAKAYREFLEQSYGSLDALNASWGTTYDNWSAVGLSDPKDNDEASSLQAGNYPRWFDRQAFKSWNFVQFCQKYRAAYEAIDPKAKVGFEGAGRFDRGDDIDLIARSNTFWSPYPGTTDEVIRSIAPREFPRANWMGYTKDADSLLAKYWRMITRGMDSVWWWRWDCIGRFHGWLAPDLRPFPAVQEILDDTRIVREGLGDLLLKSDMLDDGIAMLYSFPSSLAQRLENGPTYGGYEASHTAAHQIVRELGLQFRYVTERMLRLGEFKSENFRVLILPRADAISPRSAQVIRDFVRNGGTVIADIRPGIFNDHLKPQDNGLLDDIFGITREGRQPAKVIKDERFGATAIKIDPSVTPLDTSTSDSVDGSPVIIRNKVGKGQAILLNIDFSSYPKLGLPDTDESHAEQVRSWLTQAGVKATVRVTGKKGQRERRLETIRWENGDIQLVGLFRLGGEASNVEVELPERCAVYDLRQRKYLGKGRTCKTSIVPNRATFLAVLPQKSPKVSLGMPLNGIQRGMVGTATVSVPGAMGLHAFRLTVSTAGKELDWLSQNVLAADQKVSIPIPIALNDPLGEYEITVTDMYTGRAVSDTLNVIE